MGDAKNKIGLILELDRNVRETHERTDGGVVDGYLYDVDLYTFNLKVKVDRGISYLYQDSIYSFHPPDLAHEEL